MIARLVRALGCPHAEIWLPDYVWREAGRLSRPRARGTRHLIFCFVDHYEPHVGRVDDATARRRLDAWLERYPRMAARHGDAGGRLPGHSFFYPYDEMEPGELRDLAALCAAGCGELEIHLHHHDDTAATLRAKLRDAIRCWRDVGALGSWPQTPPAPGALRAPLPTAHTPLPTGARPAFGFIHGNWALDNSRIEGGRNFCGVNDEITILAEEGCYADFTFPALHMPAQPRQTNSIYCVKDDPRRPKSHDRGEPVRVGGAPAGQLMIVQGPLCVMRRRGRFLPRPEDGDVTGTNPATPERVDAWVGAQIHVAGRPEWVFVKVHTHGAADRNREGLLGGGFDALFADLEGRYNDGRRWRLHYVTAREMFNIIKAAEAGRAGNPDDYRDFMISRPGAGVRAFGRSGVQEAHVGSECAPRP